MKKINELTVKVTYTVSLSDVEVSEDVYKSLDSLADKGDVDFVKINSEDETAPAFDWLTTHIREADAVDGSYEIEDFE